MSDFDSSRRTLGDGLDAVPARAAEAAAALAALKAPAEQAARSIDDAFARAGTGLARSLTHAAADGKISLAELARAVLERWRRARAVRAGAAWPRPCPMSWAASSPAPGPTAAGGGRRAYLVGERGPEVFRPTTGGAIEPASSGGVNVTINVQGGDVGGPGPVRRPTGPGPGSGGEPGARRL
jgi:hypothetical protein